MKRDTSTCLVLGGAGFIGSHVTERFLRAQWRVKIVDRNPLRRPVGSDPGSEFFCSCVEDMADLPRHIADSQLVVDCMGSTRHLDALEDPEHDLDLNVRSHLAVIRALKQIGNWNGGYLYLGSRGQYGRQGEGMIREDTPNIPEDIQGVHKVTAESHLRIYANLLGLNVISLRIPNCFGEYQPTNGEDIGLLGGFIRELIRGRPLEIYGRDRIRHLVYVRDLVEVIFRLAATRWTGFQALNIAGKRVAIRDLVKMLIAIHGSGSYTVKDVPPLIRAIDTGAEQLDDSRLRAQIGTIPETKLEEALTRTVAYFVESVQ